MTSLLAGVRCFVFDIDDTLYLEREYVRSGFRALDSWVRARLGHAGFEDTAFGLFVAGERGNIFNLALASFGADVGPEVITEMVRIYREHLPEIGLLPDARRALNHCRSHASIGFVTDGPLASQSRKYSALKLASWSESVVFTDKLGPGYGKPNPEAFRRIQAITGSSGAECVYFADNPKKDFAGPKALGWKTIRVRRPGGLHFELLSGNDVDGEIADFSCLEVKEE